MHTQSKHVDQEKVRRELEQKASQKKLLNKAKIAVVVLVVLGLFYVFFQYAQSTPSIGSVGSVHAHADWTVFVDGVPVYLANSKYQLRAREVHMEDGNSTIHKHATGVTIGYFLNTLDWKFSRDCLEFDDGRRFCNNEGKRLFFKVNGIPNEEFDKYDFQDGDVIEIRFE